MRRTKAGDRAERRVGLLAYAITGLPLAIVLARYLFGGAKVFLSDDLALIDLHTRQALHWTQQLGPFDHFGWNHPGPALFYVLATVSRVLGSGAKAEFVGAILINGLVAMVVIWVLRRHAGAWVALWGSVGVAVLLFSISFTSPGDLTLSEGAAGAIVSPWNPLVVILPTLLVAVFCAAAASGSPWSLLGAAVVGSFCVQTDIGTAPVVVVLVVVTALVVGGRALWMRHADKRGEPPAVGGSTPAPTAASGRSRRRTWRAVGLVVLVAMWIPPVVQQLTNHPGNVTLIARFFTAAHPTHGLSAGLWSVVSVNSVLLFGSSVVFAPTVPIQTPLAHATVVLVVSLVVMAAALGLNISRRNRFGTALAAGSLLGFAVGIYSVTKVVGPVWGYLMLWELGLPLLAFMALGAATAQILTRSDRAAGMPSTTDQALPPPAGRGRRLAVLRRPIAMATIAISLVVCGALCYQMVVTPSVSAVSDRDVEQSVAIVTAHLRPSTGPVLVQNAGLSFFDTFRYIGLVDELDQQGYQPKVNAFWEVQFGPSFVATGHERRTIVLQPWTLAASRRPGYLGRAGDMAVRVVR